MLRMSRKGRFYWQFGSVAIHWHSTKSSSSTGFQSRLRINRFVRNCFIDNQVRRLRKRILVPWLAQSAHRRRPPVRTMREPAGRSPLLIIKWNSKGRKEGALCVLQALWPHAAPGPTKSTLAHHYHNNNALAAPINIYALCILPPAFVLRLPAWFIIMRSLQPIRL